jgi:hypothetical protein
MALQKGPYLKYIKDMFSTRHEAPLAPTEFHRQLREAYDTALPGEKVVRLIQIISGLPEAQRALFLNSGFVDRQLTTTGIVLSSRERFDLRHTLEDLAIRDGFYPSLKELEGDMAKQLEVLAREVPEGVNIDEYMNRALAIQNWLSNYRRSNMRAHRGTLKNRLLAQTPENQKDLVQRLMRLGDSDRPLNLREIHPIIIADEPKFAPIESLMKIGLLDPQIPLEPSTSAPGTPSDPSLSIDHSRST